MDATAVTAYLDRIGAPRPAVLDADGEVLAAYRDHFGIVLDRFRPSPGPGCRDRLPMGRVWP
jgi:hypothetical protein